MNKRIKRDVESSVEYILPDYMGDIKKVLMYKAECSRCDSFHSENSLELSSEVEYQVIYADAENKLTAIDLSSDLSLAIANIAPSILGMEAYANVENVTLRVTGPRKIALKSNVSVFVTLTEDGAPEVIGDSFDEQRKREVSIALINTESSRYLDTRVERELAEELERIPSLAGEDIEIIGSGGSVKIEEVRAMDGGVNIKGEIIISAIIKTPMQPPFRIVKSIPFDEAVEIDAAPGEEIYPSVYLCSLTLNENDDGEDKVIVANAIIEIDATVKSNKECEIIKDAYLLEYECENTYSTLEYNTLYKRHREVCTSFATVGLSELGCEGIHSILSSNVDIKDIVVEGDGENAKIHANILFSGIACEINADESITYYSIKKLVPFEKNVNINCQNQENMSFYARVDSKVANALIDGDSIQLECQFALDIDMVEKGKIKHLCTSTVSGEIDNRGPLRITIYYPSSGDTLFDIAKRYHTTSARICEDNSIAMPTALGDEAPLLNVKKLIIR